MARIESDREDLMRDATALVRRAEWAAPAETAPVVAGTRKDGGLSIYFGGDPCWHLDAENRLRRAFVGGDLYRTQGATLARLRRVREVGEVALLRTELTPAELKAFVSEMLERLATFTAALEDGTAVLLRAVPEDAPLTAEVLPRLRDILKEPRLAAAIPTRRM